MKYIFKVKVVSDPYPTQKYGSHIFFFSIMKVSTMFYIVGKSEKLIPQITKLRWPSTRTGLPSRKKRV